ncbi:M24 family metallopeptidase, partial [[Eubacterium] cellulosolvens]
NRWKKIQTELKKEKADAFVSVQEGNNRWLCCAHIPSFPLVTHVIIPQKGEPIAIASSLEQFRVADECAVSDVRIFTPHPYIKRDGKTGMAILKKELKKMNANTVLFDTKPKGIRGKQNNLVEKYRMVKDDAELKALRKAARLTDNAAKVLENELIKPGKTERQVALELDTELRSNKEVQAVSFETIVAAGKHAAYSHHDNTNSKLKAGDLVICDFGVYVDGYCSDMTRTFPVGGISKELEKIYNIVYDAQQNAIKSVKPGRQYNEVDTAAREVIKKKGYAKYFVHSLGHGLGLEVHEAVAGINIGTKTKMKTGHIFTIEPGVYVPGIGGARIEDDVLVTEKGVELLTKYPKKL